MPGLSYNSNCSRSIKTPFSNESSPYDFFVSRSFGPGRHTASSQSEDFSKGSGPPRQLYRFRTIQMNCTSVSKEKASSNTAISQLFQQSL